MNKTNLQIVIVIIIGLGMGWLSYSYYQKAKAYNAMSKDLNTYLYLFEQNENHIVSTVERSVIFLHFNNDLIASAIKTAKRSAQEFLQRFETRYGFYEQNYEQIKQYRQMLDAFEIEVYSFVRTNASIKNSMTYLQTYMSALEQYGTTYSEDVTDMMVHLLQLQANFKEQSGLDHDLYETLRGYEFEDEKLASGHRLYMAHLQVLYDEFGKYAQKYEVLRSFKTKQLLQKAFATFDEQNKAIQKKLQQEFETVILASAGLLVAILVYIIVIEQNRRRILKLQREQKRALTTDTLTRLKNRKALKTAMRDYKDVYMVVVNILEFRNINNLLGPSGGDYALVQLAALMKQYFGSQTFRIGSDEFAALVAKPASYDLDAKIQAFVQSVDEHTFVYQDVRFPVNVVVGVSDEYPYVINAKTAIDTIKKDFAKKIAYYTQQMNTKEQTAQNILMLQRVKTALEEDRIVPFFQPIVDLQSKEVIKYESLVRLMDEKGNPVSPFFFLDIAKRSKLYSQITETVMRKSFAFVKKYGHDVSINLSSEDIADEKTKAFIFNLLQKNASIAHKITFELVESEEIGSYEKVLAFTRQIKALGSFLAIDDFGSGYSNFEYLLKFEPDILKIDGSLIKDIARDKDMETIVKTMNSFAADAGIETVAEFVDNEKVDSIITGLGLTYGQGYYYGKPQSFVLQD
ncbi:MAG: EAL domain-containing protein [Campylobacterota bacterium]